jgi:hypothetical protein
MIRIAGQAQNYFLIAALFLSGCGLFDTRTPENPITAGSNFESPTTPTIVLRNLENALAASNAGDYRRCFSDTSQGLPSFSFIPSNQGISAAPATFNSWGIIQEEQYIRNVFAELQDGQHCSVSFNPSNITQPIVGDSVQFTATYVASFPHTRAGAERDVEGSLQFTLRKSQQNQWYIISWRDFDKDTKPSWSVVKARFADN